MKFFVEFPAATIDTEAIQTLVSVSSLLSRRIADRDIIRTVLVDRVYNIDAVIESVVDAASLQPGTTVVVDCDKWSSVAGFEITL